MISNPVPRLSDSARTQSCPEGTVSADIVHDSSSGRYRADRLAPLASLYLEGPHAPRGLTPLAWLVGGTAVVALLFVGYKITQVLP